MSENNERRPESQNETQLRGTIENKAPKPAGLLPKNTQQLVILGVAIVMVLIMWLTGGSKRPAKTSANSQNAAQVQAPDAATVEDFKQTIQKEQSARRQPISASDLARLEAVGLAGDVPPGSMIVPPDGSIPQPGGVVGVSGSTQSPDILREDKKKREYLSLFATNLAFSSRNGDESQLPAVKQPQAVNTEEPGVARQESLVPSTDFEAQLHQVEGQFAAASGAATRTMATSQPASKPQEPHESEPKNPPAVANGYAGNRHVVFEGTVLETLLINRLNGTFSGPVNCLVTTDIYSHDRQHVLIPAGSKALGEAKKVDALGQQRLAVFFHRLIMPDGFSVPLDQFKGLNQIGETSLRDKVNNHYLQIFGASLAVGILGGIAEAGTGNVLTNSDADRMRAGFGGNLANSSTQILDRFLNIPPTVTIREGSRVRVYLSGDLLLPDYAQHGMQPDL